MGVISDRIGTLRTTFRVAKATFDAAGLTAARTLTLPDVAGTLGLTSGVPSVNVLYNGPLDIWQAGTSFTGITSDIRLADGCALALSASGTWRVDQDTDVPTVAEAGKKINYSLKALCSTADNTVSAGNYCFLYCPVEGYDYAALYQQSQTVAFWVKPTLTGTYCLGLRNGSSDRCYIAEVSLTANVWQRVNVPITAAPSGGTWNFTTSVGLHLTLALVAGSTYQTTAGAWQSGNFLATSNQVNLAATINNAIYIADVSLIRGIGTPVDLPLETRFRHAQRYYQKVAATLRFVAAGANYNVEAALPFVCEMRTTPSATIVSGTRNNLAATYPQLLSLNTFSVGRFCIQSAAAGDTYALSETITLDARL